jgi:hypothetical protein
MRFRTIIATAAIGIVAVAGFGVSQADAVPVRVTSTHQSADRLYVNFNYTLPYSAAYVPSFYGSIWTDSNYPRRVRAVGRTQFNSSDERGQHYTGAYFWFGRISALRSGRYFACVRGVVQLDNGLASKHNSCRRFQLR